MTTPRTKKGQFPKGVSGNPLGRAKGARNRLTEIAEKLFDDEQEELTRKAIEMAKAGDAQMMRLCMERILPPRKDRPVTFDIGPIDGAGDHPAAVAQIVEAVKHMMATDTVEAKALLMQQDCDEMAAILLGAMARESPNPFDWTGQDMASNFIISAWRASQQTLNPMPAADYVAMIRAHADTVERLHCTGQDNDL